MARKKQEVPMVPVGEVVGMIEELRSIDKHKEIEEQAAKLGMSYEQWRRWWRNEKGGRPFNPDSQSLCKIRFELSQWQDRLRKYETDSLQVEHDVPLPADYVDNPKRNDWKSLASEMGPGDSVVVLGFQEASSLKSALHAQWGPGCSVSRKIAETGSSVCFPVRVWRTR